MSNLVIARSSFTLKAAVVLFAFADLVISYSSLGSLSGVKPRFYLLAFFAVAIILRMLASTSTGVKFYKSSSIILGLFLLFFLNAIAVNLITQSSVSFQYYVLVYLQPLLILLILPSIVEKHPKQILTAVILMGSLSAVVGILQGLDLDVAWNLRTLVSEQLPRGMRLNNRSPGLLSISVRQAQLLLLSLAAILAFNIVANRNKTLWFGLVCVHLIAIFLSGTRSALIAALAMLVVTFWVKFPSKRIVQIGFGLVCVAVVVAAFPILESFSTSRLVSVSDTSANVRVLFLKIGANLIVDNPFGYGARSFAPVTGTSDLSLATFADDGAVGKIGELESHNYFLNIFFYYGLQGGALIAAIYVYFMSRTIRLIRQPDEISQLIGLAAVLAIVGQFVDSFLHNSGLLNGYTGLVLFWVAVEAQHRFIHRRG